MVLIHYSSTMAHRGPVAPLLRKVEASENLEGSSSSGVFFLGKACCTIALPARHLIFFAGGSAASKAMDPAALELADAVIVATVCGGCVSELT